MDKIVPDRPQGTLYLIPNTLGDADLQTILPYYNSEVIKSIGVFITENIRTARRFLKKIDKSVDIDSLEFHVLDERTRVEDTREYLHQALAGNDIGLISEAGTPCVADPGAIIVRRAHHLGIKVVPLVGPNSIILALMASGFNGQNFQFHGYIPISEKERSLKG